MSENLTAYVRLVNGDITSYGDLANVKYSEDTKMFTLRSPGFHAMFPREQVISIICKGTADADD